jgi:hypothetical protein
MSKNYEKSIPGVLEWAGRWLEWACAGVRAGRWELEWACAGRKAEKVKNDGSEALICFTD